jgi:hypothetical protein
VHEQPERRAAEQDEDGAEDRERGGGTGKAVRSSKASAAAPISARPVR